MWPRKGNLTSARIVGVLIVTLVALTGCAEVEVVDTTPAATDRALLRALFRRGPRIIIWPC